MSSRETVLLKLSHSRICDSLFMLSKRFLRTVAEVSELFSFTLELRKSWWRRGENVQKLEVQQEDENIFAPGTPFQLCS